MIIIAVAKLEKELATGKVEGIPAAEVFEELLKQIVYNQMCNIGNKLAKITIKQYNIYMIRSLRIK